MIFITGDTHASFEGRFSMAAFPEQKEMTKEDYLIICGDFGGIWEDKESKSEKYWLDWFETRNYTLLFVDGNHENFNRLYSYLVKEWNGGKVHVIRPHVLHLMRGQVFEISEKKIFTFGGAQSHDIPGGPLDRDDPEFEKKKKSREMQWIPYRIKNETWWEQELPSNREMAEGLSNLDANDWEVDYIITHCCPSSTQAIMSTGEFKPDILTNYFEEIKEKTKFKKWFFGHYHDNRNVSTEEILIYEQIIQIA